VPTSTASPAPTAAASGVLGEFEQRERPAGTDAADEADESRQASGVLGELEERFRALPEQAATLPLEIARRLPRTGGPVPGFDGLGLAGLGLLVAGIALRRWRR
jgi:hypothetical protein